MTTAAARKNTREPTNVAIQGDGHVLNFVTTSNNSTATGTEVLTVSAVGSKGRPLAAALAMTEQEVALQEFDAPGVDEAVFLGLQEAALPVGALLLGLGPGAERSRARRARGKRPFGRRSRSER